MSKLSLLLQELAASDGIADSEIKRRLAQAGFAPVVTPLRVLRQARLEVSEIVDVGVFRGTPFLYKAFPDCDFLLVDPQRDAESLLTVKPRRYTFANVALGRANGEMILSAQGSCSSFLTWADEERANPDDRYPVSVTTLDALIQDHLQSDRIGIKIDAEGFEAEIIAGLDTMLPRIVFVIVEVSIKQRLRDAPYFSDIVARMGEKGFAFYNVLDALHPAPPRYCDVLFLRRDDPRLTAVRAGTGGQKTGV